MDRPRRWRGDDQQRVLNFEWLARSPDLLEDRIVELRSGRRWRIDVDRRSRNVRRKLRHLLTGLIPGVGRQADVDRSTLLGVELRP